LLLGANATSATARNLGEVRAAIGDNATLTVSGITRVSADNASRQRAEAEGLSLGILALGANISRAESSTVTEATLQGGVKLTGSTLQLTATGNDDNLAYALAGSGGAVSGLASDASTSNSSVTTARTGVGSDTRAI